MSGCEAQTFSGITQEHFDCLVQKAQASFGITISGDSGSQFPKWSHYRLGLRSRFSKPYHPVH